MCIFSVLDYQTALRVHQNYNHPVEENSGAGRIDRPKGRALKRESKAMFSFLILILAIAGAVLGFMTLLIERVSQKPKTRLIMMFAALGCLILTGQQVVAYLNGRNQDSLQQTRSDILKEIRKKVTNMHEMLESALADQSPAAIGVEFVQSVETNELLQYAKGSPAEWRSYADWLRSFAEQEEQVPCLSLTVNAGRNYDVGLLLAYLLTNSQTESLIRSVISRGPPGWAAFPEDTFTDEHGFPEPSVKYVLIYDGTSRKLIGYADAKLFTRELLLYKNAGKRKLVEDALNRGSSTSVEDIEKLFKAFISQVAEKKNAYEAAEEMLGREISEMALLHNGKTYLIKLSKIVRIVS